MSKKNPIIFLKSDIEGGSANWNHVDKKRSFLSTFCLYFWIPYYEFPNRIYSSFIPPLFLDRYRRVYVDLLGPSLAVLILSAILHYGHSNKHPDALVETSPIQALICYATFMPFLGSILTHLGQANISLIEMIALLGYGLYGHIFTFAFSLLFYHEKSNVFFFFCMSIFGGLSALRVALVLLKSIRIPAARLIVCSIISTLQLLSLIFLHFAYMHRTFVYGANKSNN